MIDFVGLLILLVLVVAFAFMATRAWRAKNKIVKWVGVIVAGLLTVVFAAVLLVALFGTSKLLPNYNSSNPVVAVKVAGTPEQIARGEKLAHICAGCHGPQEQLPLSGTDFGANIGLPIGTLWARNLTPGGELKDWSDGEIIRAFREGIHKSGRSLIIMPANEFHNWSDEDAQAMVAYLRSQQPVTPDAPPNSLNVIGAALLPILGGDGVLTHQPHITQPIVAPPAGATAEYGKYLVVDLIGCKGCHGENLAGGKLDPNGPPAGPNLTAFVPKWDEAGFIKTIRTGVTPEGQQLTDEMPWKGISALSSDDDLKAMYAYLHGLAPLPDNRKQ